LLINLKSIKLKKMPIAINTTRSVIDEETLAKEKEVIVCVLF